MRLAPICRPVSGMANSMSLSLAEKIWDCMLNTVRIKLRAAEMKAPIAKAIQPRPSPRSVLTKP